MYAETYILNVIFVYILKQMKGIDIPLIGREKFLFNICETESKIKMKASLSKYCEDSLVLIVVFVLITYVVIFVPISGDTHSGL
jgi:hypothetical protein